MDYLNCVRLVVPGKHGVIRITVNKWGGKRDKIQSKSEQSMSSRVKRKTKKKIPEDQKKKNGYYFKSHHKKSIGYWSLVWNLRTLGSDVLLFVH